MDPDTTTQIGDAVSGIFTDLGQTFLTVVVPGAVGLILAFLVFGLAVKYVRKTSKQG